MVYISDELKLTVELAKEREQLEAAQNEINRLCEESMLHRRRIEKLEELIDIARKKGW